MQDFIIIYSASRIFNSGLKYSVQLEEKVIETYKFLELFIAQTPSIYSTSPQATSYAIFLNTAKPSEIVYSRENASCISLTNL